jgi:hypothetical protein
LVSEEELVAILNEELAKHEAYERCQFIDIKMLRDENSEGCNWYEAELRGGGVPIEICKTDAHRIVYEAMKKYNVKR